MIEDDNNKIGPIAFSGESCETSTVLELFLDLLHGGSLPLPDRTGVIAPTEAVINLARKYDCPGTLYTINSVLRGAVVDDSLNQLEVFILLSQFEDVSGCAEGIRRYGSDWIDAGSLGTLDEPVNERSWANPASWGYARASRANPRFLFALFRAVQVSTHSQTHWQPRYSEFERGSIANEFAKLLRSARMSSPCASAVLRSPPSAFADTVRHWLMRRPTSVGQDRDGADATRA